MAFPASTYSKARAWQEICSSVIAVRDSVRDVRNSVAGSSVSLIEFVKLHARLNAALGSWATLVQTPGLQAYAQDQISNPGLDLVAEYQAMRSSVVAVRDWIASNGDTLGMTVTPAEAAPFVALADAMILTVG